MKKKTLRVLALLLALACCLCMSGLADDAVPQNDAGGDPGAMMGDPPDGAGGGMMGDPPDGMGGGGAAPAGDAAPENGAIVINDGSENTDAEYDAGAWSDYVSKDGETVVISGLDMTGDDYTFNGIIATGSVVRLEKSTICLNVDAPATDDDDGGSAVCIDDGTTLYINDSELTVEGAARYVTAAYNDATLVVNNSSVTSTGSCDNTADVSEPFSNEALLISGTARANFSIGATKTYYFNSTCTAEGWAALSTDSATGDGLDLYAYNTDAVAQNGGYGTYADTNCRVWLYGSRLQSAEIGCIISKSGQIHACGTDAADEDLLAYDESGEAEAESEILGGRNAVMIHAPDMMGEGVSAADCGTFEQTGGKLATSDELVSTKDYSEYSDAIGAYIDYVTGDTILIRSTSANITLDGVEMESFNGTLIHSVLNADSQGNFLASGDADAVNPIAVSMTDMDVEGDILHEDYQRNMTVSLSGTTLTGAITAGSMESWNDRWSEYGEVNWVVDDIYEMPGTLAVTLDEGSVWNVVGTSSLSSLTIAEGAEINGTVTVDGEVITPAAGETYTGVITVNEN